MSRQLFYDWLGFRVRSRRRRQSQRSASLAPHRRVLRFEPLESRQLLSITVNTLADENDGIGVGDISLRDAIAAAAPGETINFEVRGTITLTHGELAINKSLAIAGPGANLLAIDANGNSRVFNVDNGTAALANVQISGLTITGGITGGDGGGVLNQEALTITGCWITGNQADDGGGIGNFSGTFNVVNSTISGNTSTGVSGGGGGIFNFSSNLGQTSTITNSTISGNSAATRGGGVNNFEGTLNIQFSTITNNTAPVNAGSGVSSWTDINTTATNIRSSIVAGNTGTDADIFPKTFPPSQPTFHSLGYNLIGSGDAAQFFVAAGDTKNVTGAALMLGTLTDNGGPTPTHLPLRGSPAIDTGDPSAVANMSGVPQFDQRGTPYSRVFDGDAVGGARIDKGAVESDAVYFVVDTLMDNIAADGHVSLREAIVSAGSVSAGTPTIVFDTSLTTGDQPTISLALGQLTIDHALAIDGPGANRLKIDAHGESIVFNVDDANPNAAQIVKLSGLTLTGGYNNNGGGAIFNREQLTVSDCVLSGNTAQWGGGIYNDTTGELTVLRSQISGNHAIEPIPMALGSGGGLYNWGGSVTILDSTISGNDSVTRGGGILNANGGYISIARSTINGNTAVESGGGIANGDGFMKVESSTISGNHAAKGGGLVLATPNFQVTTIRNSTFSGNVAPLGGGGIYNSGGQAVIEFCTITRNVSNDFAGSGVLSAPSPIDSPTSFYSSIIVANFDPTGGAQSAPYDVSVSGSPNSFTSLGYNIVGIGGYVNDTFHSEFGDQIIGTDNPLLGPLADNGGPVKTHALLAGSRAIDGGNPDATAGLDGVPVFDERGTGYRRVRDGDGDATARIDIGALEAQSPPPALLGDYNLNHTVDAADYTVWRHSLGQHVTPYSGADGNGSGVIDAVDYSVWKANFGNTPGPGGAATIFGGASDSIQRSEFSSSRSSAAKLAYGNVVGAIVSPVFSAPLSTHALTNSASAGAERTPSLQLPTDDALLTWLSSQRMNRTSGVSNAPRARSAHLVDQSVGSRPEAVDLVFAALTAELEVNFA